MCASRVFALRRMKALSRNGFKAVSSRNAPTGT
jgi:hypothetical protein